MMINDVFFYITAICLMVNYTYARNVSLSTVHFQDDCIKLGLPWYIASNDKEHVCCGCPGSQFVAEDCSKRRPKSVRCELCPDGTFTSGPNTLKKCQLRMPLSTCDNLQHTIPIRGNSTTDNRCQCKPGTFSINPNEEGCKVFQLCIEGFGVSRDGNSTHDVKCEKCPIGKCSFSNSSFDRCLPCKDIPKSLDLVNPKPSDKPPPVISSTPHQPTKAEEPPNVFENVLSNPVGLVIAFLIGVILTSIVIFLVQRCCKNRRNCTRMNTGGSSSADQGEDGRGSSNKPGEDGHHSPNESGESSPLMPKGDVDSESSGQGTSIASSATNSKAASPVVSTKHHQRNPSKPESIKLDNIGGRCFDSPVSSQSEKETSFTHAATSVESPAGHSVKATDLRQTNAESFSQPSLQENEAKPSYRGYYHHKNETTFTKEHDVELKDIIVGTSADPPGDIFSITNEKEVASGSPGQIGGSAINNDGSYNSDDISSRSGKQAQNKESCSNEHFQIRGSVNDLQLLSLEHKRKLEKLTESSPDFNLSQEFDSVKLANEFLTGDEGLRNALYPIVTALIKRGNLVKNPTVLIDDKEREKVGKTDEIREALVQQIIVCNGQKLTLRKLMASSVPVPEAHALFQDLFVRHIEQRYPRKENDI